MIPKIIHYCWFGGNPLPPLAVKCIESWKKYCPDYEIIEWNEDNFDISSAPLYVRQAYEAKKWAFVTDYVRLKVVYDCGGIYLDTDVELLKNLDCLLENNAYFGFEDGYYVATGLGFGSIKQNPLLYELMEDYNDISFVREDGSFDLKPCPVRNTEVFLRHGLTQNNQKQILDGGYLILPSSVLCPVTFQTGKKRICRDTVSIHHFSASWQSPEQVKQYRKQVARKKRSDRWDRIVHTPNRVVKCILGNDRYDALKERLKGK